MLKCDRNINNKNIIIFTYLSILEPLNFGAVDVKLRGGKIMKEANFLWKTFIIPEND